MSSHIYYNLNSINLFDHFFVSFHLFVEYVVLFTFLHVHLALKKDYPIIIYIYFLSSSQCRFIILNTLPNSIWELKGMEWANDRSMKVTEIVSSLDPTGQRTTYPTQTVEHRKGRNSIIVTIFCSRLKKKNIALQFGPSVPHWKLTEVNFTQRRGASTLWLLCMRLMSI